ncbi:unnamed protein product [Owenia fusiformis]|uniref:Cytochrome P450 n=1 Tax=Owenia fusiformis TaxID=6347 RepID=A0A8S4NVQ8_OWEFU|nr:unnamed protein product [Owenia fusiformis]
MAVFMWLAALLSVTLIGAYFKIFYRKRRPGEPTIADGHFLWGNGEEFNTHAVEFLHKCKKTLGNIFTIRLLNQHLTIVMDPHAYESFHKQKEFDFDPIQKQVNMNVFSFELKDSQKLIKGASKMVRGNYMANSVQNFVNNVHLATEENLICNKDEWSQDGLRLFCAKTMFDSLYQTLFGRAEVNTLKMYHDFEVYHKYFNFLWLGLPRKMFPQACKALEGLVQQPTPDELIKRDDISEYMRTAIKMLQDLDQTDSEIIGHNLVYLHVNYNTFRVGFWVLEYILQHPEAYGAIMEEIDDMVYAKSSNNNSTEEDVSITTHELERLPVLESIVQETFRLSSGVFMVRYVNGDTWYTLSDGSKHLIRDGDRVAIYPPALHKDPEVFENPNEFKYDRFIDAKFHDKNGAEIKHPIIGFGSLCPGKRYALIQLKWFVLYMLNRFEFEHLEGEKAELDFQYHGHEIIPPKKDVQIRYRELSNRRTLCLE